MTTTYRHAAQGSPHTDPTAQSAGPDSVAGGAVTRLNPADGLFLRAEHLNRMQHYTGELAALLGAGLGPGVVSGFMCTLSKDHDEVQVTGGLAVANGRPLASSEPASVSLRDLNPAFADFWVVEIIPTTWTFGSEPVYGGLCEDPCGQGSGIKPFAAEGIELRLRKDHCPWSGDWDPATLRNRLASFYFERERSYGGEPAPSPNAPWLIPQRKGASMSPLGSRPWADGTGSYDYEAVPLAIVFKEGKEWVIDVWSARRDIGVSTPTAAWQWRLGWRPHNVFMAQIRQFQDQLADAGQAVNDASTVIGRQINELRSAAKVLSALSIPAAAEVVSLAEQFEEQLVLPDLRAAGFEELPPAGYLPLQFPSLEEAQRRAVAIFGYGVDIRVLGCRADFVAHAVEEAQHLDRIPLAGDLGRPQIDLLVPLEPADLTDTYTPAYLWSAFVRRRGYHVLESSDQLDEVEVWITEGDGDDAVLERIAERAAGGRPHGRRLGVVSYPADRWDVPTDQDSVWKEIRDKLADDEHGDVSLVGVVATAHGSQRLALAGARGSLLMAPTSTGDGFERLPSAYVATVAPGRPEAIIVVWVRAST